ncbi:hypothetical protein SEPCBS119000_005780 [Sporothrix epigloea]|uniref:Protein kinase domain-containing protein n=1 Tax=Sporothrix epigloea TaxID=1892477 RepID=A0ABP0E1A5_9PEZI
MGIRFSDPEGPISLLTSQDDDHTPSTHYFLTSDLCLPFPIKTLRLDSLTELSRMGQQVDLVSYPEVPTAGGVAADTKAVFKYWFTHRGMNRPWNELQIWARLPRDHPHIVPFDAIVLDHISGGVIGLTSMYIPGETLLETSSTVRPFRLKWFQQLLSVVDDLNYRYGVMQQDIAPRNIVVDAEDNIRIFNFDFSGSINERSIPERDDSRGVIFTLYEIITLDMYYRRRIHFTQQEVDALLLKQWVMHPDVKLDSEVHEFRKVLDAWLDKRKTREYYKADTWLEWPFVPGPPVETKLTYGPNWQVTGKETMPFIPLYRRDLIRIDEPYLNWERPASYRLRDLLEKQRPQKEICVPTTTTEQDTGKSEDEVHGNE